MLLGSNGGEEQEKEERRRMKREKDGWGDVRISMTVTEMF